MIARSKRALSFGLSSPQPADPTEQFEKGPEQQQHKWQQYRPTAVFRAQEKVRPMPEGLLPSYSMDDPFGALSKRSSNYADFQRNCYFSPVQCVLVERRRRR
ncbi:hypothetical protein AAVH_06445 [Aphelenchoides avenae]|nr:hypothetical protein AAVH_06445 [Aphelenchus avenae]